MKPLAHPPYRLRHMRQTPQTNTQPNLANRDEVELMSTTENNNHANKEPFRPSCSNAVLMTIQT